MSTPGWTELPDAGPSAPGEETLREVIETLAPIERRAGSDGERQAAEWIAARLTAAGCRARVEAESFLDGYARVMSSLSAAGAVAGLAALASRRRLGRRVAGVAAAALSGSAALLAPLWALPYVPASVLAWIWFHRVRRRSHRLAAVADGLRANGVEFEIDGDDLIVHGRGRPPGGGTVVTHMDHRIAMAFVVMGLASEQPVKVDDVSFIATSFPGFVAMMRGLGADLA